MKYSKEIYQLFARLNPAIYDAIFPHGPVTQFQFPATRQLITDRYQAQGSVFGTDLSGELHLLSKLTWKMKNLVEDLRIITTHARVNEQGITSRGINNLVSEIVDEYCGNVPKKIPFPPKPHWFNDKLTIEEKVSAATIIAQAAASVKGTELENVLYQGADKIIDSALTEFTNVPSLKVEPAHN